MLGRFDWRVQRIQFLAVGLSVRSICARLHYLITGLGWAALHKCHSYWLYAKEMRANKNSTVVFEPAPVCRPK